MQFKSRLLHAALLIIPLPFFGCVAHSLPEPMSSTERATLAELPPVQGTLAVEPFGEFKGTLLRDKEWQSDSLIKVFAGSGKFSNVVAASDGSTPQPIGVLRFKEKRRQGENVPEATFFCPRHPFFQIFTLFFVPVVCHVQREYVFELSVTGETEKFLLTIPEQETHVSGWAALFLHPFPGWTIANVDTPRYFTDRLYEKVLLQSLQKFPKQ